MQSTTIPFGLASKLMAIVAAAAVLIGIVTAIIEGDHSEETIASGVIAAFSLFTLAGGRYAQAAMKTLADYLAGGEIARDPKPADAELRDLHEGGQT